MDYGDCPRCEITPFIHYLDDLEKISEKKSIDDSFDHVSVTPGHNPRANTYVSGKLKFRQLSSMIIMCEALKIAGIECHDSMSYHADEMVQLLNAAKKCLGTNEFHEIVQFVLGRGL